jgi:hypothetical protein
MPRPRKLPAIPIAELADRYRSGEPLYELALRAKVSSERVRALLVGAGVELRTVAEINRMKGARRAETWARKVEALTRLGPPKG